MTALYAAPALPVRPPSLRMRVAVLRDAIARGDEQLARHVTQATRGDYGDDGLRQLLAELTEAAIN